MVNHLPGYEQDSQRLTTALPTPETPIWQIPDPVTRATVAPPALYLLEPIDATLLSSEAASRSINVFNTGFRIDSEMKKEIDYLPI